jgi:class 3 adenylate cyclase
MAERKVVVLIADIGGYTNFIRAHKTALVHADLIVHGLLDSVVKASRGGFELSKLEGDAAFLFASEDQAPEDLAPVFAAMYRAFHATQQEIDKNQTCGCMACVGAEGLKLKIVAHRGEALVRKIRKTNELTGECVIAVHRMLKNEVPLREYVLLSEDLAQTAKPKWQCKLVASRLAMEGFGDFPTAYLDLRDLAGEVPPGVKHPWPSRLITNLWHGTLALPYRLGLKQPLKNFRNVGG